MPDPRDFRKDVEQRVELPDFARISRRAHRLRRRRTLAVAGSVTVLAAALLVATARPWASDRAVPPPAPIVGDVDAAAVLADPRAYAADDGWVLSDTGAVMDTVVAPSSLEDPLGCGIDGRVALVWTNIDGPSRAWSERIPARTVVAVPGGFVVSAVSPRCRTGAAGEEQAYVVDAEGRRTPLTWSGDGGTCPQRPELPRCVVDVATATGLVDGQPGTDVPPGAGAVPAGRWGSEVWATSMDSTRVHWSVDGGRTWQAHRTALTDAPEDNVQVTVAGDWIVFERDLEVEYSSDHGETWQRRDLTTALSPVLVASELWSVLPSGVLLGVTQPVGSRAAVFASTDATWSVFEQSDVQTAYGTLVPRIVGDWAYLRDHGVGWMSQDGRHWARLDPLRRR